MVSYRFRANTKESIKAWMNIVVRRRRWQVCCPCAVIFFLDAVIIRSGWPLFLLLSFSFLIAAFSGNSKVLFNRKLELAEIGEENFMLSYLPYRFEHKTYNKVVFVMDYLDIDRLIYEKGKGRLTISGEYRIRYYFYRPAGNSYFVEKDRSGRLYVYQRYGEAQFDSIMEKLKFHSLIGIEVRSIEEDRAACIRAFRRWIAG